MKLKIGDREVDLNQALPLQVKDLRYLGDQGLLTADGAVALSDINKILDFAVYLTKKVDKSVTTEEFDELDMAVVSEAIQQVSEKMGESGVPPTKPSD